MVAPLLFALTMTPALAVTAPAFDRVVLTDGRIIEGDIIESDDPDHLLLRVESVDVPIRTELVKQTFREITDDYVPRNKKEEQYLKKGWVLFEGHWMAKRRREQELAKRAADDKRAIAEIRDRQKWKNAIEKSSPHFIVKSNCDEDVIDDYLGRLEQCYKYFRSEWGSRLSPGERKGKLGLDLYRSARDLFHIASAGGQTMISFSFGTGDMRLIYDAFDPDGARRNLYEAAFSQLSYYMNPKFLAPRWFIGAMSDYFATVRVDENGDFHLGEPRYGYLFRIQDAIKEGKLPPLIDAINPEEHEYKPIHTPMRWSFLHFLMESPKYGKAVKTFYTTLSKNKDANIRQGVSWYRKGAAVDYVTEEDLLSALEKRLGRSIGQLEVEWLESLAGLETGYPAEAYDQAGARSVSAAEHAETDEEGDELIEAAFKYYAKAAELGLARPYFYRKYAELLRKGGIREQRSIHVPREPDPVKAWKMIQIGIELDPIAPYSYTEAAGILILDGPVQDLDKAADFAATAMALAGPRDYGVKSLHDDLMALIEPAREKRRIQAEMEAELAASDLRTWLVQPHYTEGDPVPEQLTDLSTSDVSELIRAGTINEQDWIFQSYYRTDPDTGEAIKGEEPWNNEWVLLKDVPVFADALAAAAAEGTR